MNLPSPSQFVPGPSSGEAGQTWGSAALLFLKATLAMAGRGQGWGSQQADVPTSLFIVAFTAILLGSML